MKNISTTFVFIALIGATLVDAQDNKQSKKFGIFDSKNALADFFKALKRESKEDRELATMIPMIKDLALGKPVGFTSGGGKSVASPLGLLADPKVREELDIVDSEFGEIQQVNLQIQKQATKELTEIDLSDKDSLTAKVKAIKAKAEKEINALLLPHQSKRLFQLESQSRLHKQSLGKLITSDPLGTELKITDEQKSDLLKAEKEIEAELESEIASLREKAREKLLSRLKKSQREHVEELLGEDFQFSKQRGKDKSDSRKEDERNVNKKLDRRKRKNEKGQ